MHLLDNFSTTIHGGEVVKKIIYLLFLFGLSTNIFSQIDARLFQFPDVSNDKIAFYYAGDIWVVDKNGGTAVKLSSPVGEEVLPKFSPDGSTIAFSGNYDGNVDVYTIPVGGGIPTRVTYHPYSDRIQDWTSNGSKILFSSSRESGRQRFSQLYTIDANSGIAEKLPVPFGEFGAISEDGELLAYTFTTRLFRTWKRYRGGTAADIWLFNLKTNESKNISNHIANDELPMWHGKKVYFLSDRGEEKRFNIWVYNTEDSSTKQVTKFKDFDIHFPSIGPEEIVFQAGGKIYLLNLTDESYKEVQIKIISDQLTLLPETKKVGKSVASLTPSPDGKRVTVEARGEVFSVPAKDGVIYNLTNSSGAAERYPSWSPDGEYIAYWSDKSGEYELMLKNMNDINNEKKVTSTGEKYKYNLYWSPNSKKIVFIDNAMRIRYYDLDKDKLIDIDRALYKYHGSLQAFKVNWSSDSRYITYDRGLDNRQNAVFIYDTEDSKLHQVTSGFYSDSDPVFDPEGKYLYYQTLRSFLPAYSNFDNSWIYSNATQLAAVPLTADIPSPIAPKNDQTEVKKEDDKEKKDEKKSGEDEKKEEKSVKIDFDGFESRVVILPIDAGNFGSLGALKGKLIFHKFPNSGSEAKERPLKYYDFEEREEKTIADNVSFFELTADGNKILVGDKGSYYIIEPKPGQKLKDAIPTNDLEVIINPMEEWMQIFTDAWRLERDMFYDPNMHGVDWEKIREQYGNLVKYCATRTDLNFLIGEMIAELSASHTYRGGGDLESPERQNVGLLGIDWSLENGRYRIAEIISGAEWDAEARSPLAATDLKVKKGDYILAVNGIELNSEVEPYSAFAGLAGKTVELTVNDKASLDGSRKIIVKTMNDESRLRHLAWIENNRKYVDELSGGKLGYVYVRSTGVDGQNELVRQFYAQQDKEGLVIDERFNSGGQIPDRFIELLDRKPLAFWAVRDGKTWQWPPVAHFGVKAMLINGWSGSGGDAFPDYFRKAGLGKLIGTRTWGGLIGITGSPQLIDGGSVTVPTFRMYNPDGTWFKEGHGVDPDIEVVEDPTIMASGTDPQLKKAVEVLMQELRNRPSPQVAPPSYEVR